jgi:hypothetical protein
MASAFDKQHSSRPNVNQILAYLGGGATVASTNFGVATQQIRVVSEVQAGCPSELQPPSPSAAMA